MPIRLVRADGLLIRLHCSEGENNAIQERLSADCRRRFGCWSHGERISPRPAELHRFQHGQFTGEVMFITYLGPPGPPNGQNIWHATADFTWVSNGGTPASNILVNFELAVDGVTEHWTVTGADLGWGSGPGTYSSTIGTDMLNGLLTPNGPGGSTIIHVDIGTTTGDGLTGGHFDNSSFTLELAPVPAPSALCVLVGSLIISR